MGAVFRWIKYIYEWCKSFGLKLGAGGVPIGAGKVFYIHHENGDDATTGLDPAHPLKTIKKALEHCVAFRNDYIMVLDSYQEAFPIVVNKYSVHIIGMNSLQGMPCRLIASGNTAIFTIDTDYYEIAGFSMTAGADHGCIEVVAESIASRGSIHDCWFGVHGTCQDGIFVPDDTGLYSCAVFNNVFGALIRRDGLRFEGSGYRSPIYDNVFHVNPAGDVHGIHIIFAGAQIWYIKDNDFRIATDDQAGKAIQIEVGANVIGVIGGNKAAQGAVGMTNNPYRDLGTGVAETSSHWSMNYEGNGVEYPDFA